MGSQKVCHDCLTHTMGVEIYAYPEPWTHYIPGGYQYGFGDEYRTLRLQFVSSPKTRKQDFVYICLSKQNLHKDYRQNIAWCFSLFFNLYYPFIIVVVVVSLNHVWPFSNPIDCSPADPSAHEISQARVLEWVAITFSRASTQPKDKTYVSWLAGGFLF